MTKAIVKCAIALGMMFQVEAAHAQPDGMAVYRQRCQACHGAPGAQPSPLGPKLAGVVGRAAASTPFAYSTALKASKIFWTRANLEKFLAGPTKMVPGTRMVMVVPDPAQRSALVGYLAKMK